MKNNLRQIRIQKGITQQELADLTELSRTKISEIETEKDIPLKSNTILAISKALNIPVSKIFPAFK